MTYRVSGIKGPGEGFRAATRRIRRATLPAMLALAAAVAQGQNPTTAPRPTNPTTVTNPTNPTTVPLPTPIPLPYRLDHFLCYLVQPPQVQVRPGLAMIDQFNPKPIPFALPERQWLCNPVSKNQEPVHNKQAHLTGYLLKGPAAEPRNIPVIVNNQFGAQRYIVLQENKFLVPTGKAPILAAPTTAVPPPPPIPQGLDHFACYTVKPEAAFKPRSVLLVDQFGRLEGEAVEPLFLCNPAQKLIDNRPTGPIVNARDHLMCYALKTGGFQPRKVQIHNQFETLAVEAARPAVLCVPSTKERIQPGK